MNIDAMIPAAVTLPANWAGLNMLVQLLFMIHLIAAGLLVGFGIIHFTHICGKARQNLLYAYAGRSTAHLINAAIITGILMFIFLGATYGPFILSAAVICGRFWMAILLLVGIGMSSAYAAGRTDSHQLIFAATTLACLLLSAFFFTGFATLMQSPAWWTAYYEHPRGTWFPFGDASIYPRFLLFIIMSVCIGGLFTALTARLDRSDRPDRDRDRDRDRRYYAGLNWFANAAIFSLPLGIWYTLTLPPIVRDMINGADHLTAVVMAAAYIFILVAALYAGRGRLSAATANAGAALIAAVAVRNIIRTTLLQAYSGPQQISPQF